MITTSSPWLAFLTARLRLPSFSSRIPYRMVAPFYYLVASLTVHPVRYEEAVAEVDSRRSEAARSWLLSYNRNDVEATRAVRQWLGRGAGNPPRLEDLGP